ncbi:Disease resistance protein [Melia azedarach]|uniref:Disease resistance protein n=1 Tax=Melia azedarach TaxID=155640 RepID=A0ACC1Y3R1_MELAZ|nr:Disease resistance protein [Melia azedarach]
MAYKKKPEDWKHAIKVLRTSTSKFSGMEEKVFWRLKFSYDSLFSDTIRSCFLYCCLFPEDFWFDKEDLIDCWIDEGFANDFEDGFAIISDLLRACLLEEAGDHVKMHDVIRDMALWIACKIEKEKENFLVRVSARLTNAPKIEEWKGVKRISLMENKIESLSTIPTCPSLLTLILVKNNITTINNGFFQFMPSLRVLNLAYNRNLTEVPSGISCLISLEHLNLSFTSILELPVELKELINLRYLNLEGVESLFEIPPQLLSSFSKLRVLRMRGCSTPDIAKRSNCVLFKDASLLINEFLSLDKLKVLSIDLYSSRAFQIFFTFQKLLPCTKSLGLADIKNPMAIDVLPLAYMKNLKRLELQRCDFKELKFGYAGVQKVLQVGFPSLGRVFLYFCSSMKDLTWLAFAPNLKIIDMWYCKSIEEILKAEKLSETS